MLYLFNIKYFYSSIWPALTFTLPFTKDEWGTWDPYTGGGGRVSAIGIAFGAMATPMNAEAALGAL